MKLLVIQHDHTSPLGPILERFVERGYEPTMHLVVPEGSFRSPGVETDFPDFTDFDAVVVMGAPWSVYDEELIGSWVEPESERLVAADRAGVPVLGICFGGQLLAQSLGGSVQRSAEPEIGWTEVETDEASLVAPGPWFQWHYDSFEVPAGAREVARNALSPQAFVLRRNLGVQFHPELTPPMLQGWLDVGGDAEVRQVGLDPEVLMVATQEQADAARSRAHALVDGFLDHVADRPVEHAAPATP